MVPLQLPGAPEPLPRACALLGPIVAAALEAVEPGRAVRAALGLRVQNGAIRVGEEEVLLASRRRVLVVGAGKAAGAMAAAVEDVLEPTGVPVQGIVTVRYGHGAPTRHVIVREAGHPLPDAAGVEATRAMLALLRGASADDLVVCVISGGGSALLTDPDEVSLDELRTTVDLLLRSGATIQEVNAVRKHLDRVKGGRLARAVGGAPLLTLVLSDVVGNPLESIASGPTVPDSTTWARVDEVLRAHGLWERLPSPVAARLRQGLRGDLPDTPKEGDPCFARAAAVLVGSNDLACRAAARAAEQLGLRSVVLSTSFEGEARYVGQVLGAILREEAAADRPIPRPCCLVGGGETTVTVRGSGLGGRNQEVALGAALAIEGAEDVLLASIGTDGSDGPTDAAGAWVDGATVARAARAGYSPAAALANNDAYPLLAAAGGLVMTGPTGTNVNDLYLLLALPAERAAG